MRTIKQIIFEHLAWKKQIFTLSKADLKKTYTGSALGWAWALIKPSITIFIYWYAFSLGLRRGAGVDGIPFFYWLIGGIIPWFYISEMWVSSPWTMRQYSYLITKMKFPTSTIPTFTSISRMMVHICLVTIVIVIYLFGGMSIDKYMLQLPFYMFMMFLMATGWGLFASVIGAFSRDFGLLVKSFSLALFWLSGIMWPISKIKSMVGKFIFQINPVTFVVEGYRNCFVYKKWFWEEPILVLYFVIEILIVWFFAILVFRNLKKEMPDVL